MASTTNWTKVHDDDDFARSGNAATLRKLYTFKCNSSYVSGGDDVTPATDINLQTGDTIIACNITEPDGSRAYEARYDAVNNKVVLYDKDTGASMGNGDYSAPTFLAEFQVKRG